MEHKLLDILQEFIYNLQKITPNKLEELEITLPYSSYKQLEWEVSEITSSYTVSNYTLPSSNLFVRTGTGCILKVTCEEIKEAELQSKLEKCFKILSK